MMARLLRSKLYIPPPRASLVARPHLAERIDMGSECKLTLISAPAGFGKTTQIIQWIAQKKKRAAWLSLDPDDNDPFRFMQYFIAAVRNVFSSVGYNAQSLLESSQYGLSPAVLESMMTSLINEIEDQDQPLALILDDYHSIQNQILHDALIFLMDHRPPQLQLVVACRADPPWPLGRLRARQEINEIRAADLQFSPGETTAFLNDTMGLNLSSDAVLSLEERTEGWIAGLQMAALSMKDRQDKTAFISAFTGSHHFIADFLVEEVLSQQPENVRDFLIKTSVLERLTPPLCDMLLEINDSRSILTRLEQTNLFLVCLDDERRWYRYHHLFKDLLRNTFENAFPDEVHPLQKKASGWFAEARLYDFAIPLAFACQNYDWTARMIEKAADEMDFPNKLVTINRWIEDLPEDVIARRPRLCVQRAWGRQWTGKRQQVEVCLQAAEKGLQSIRVEVPDEITAEEERHIRGHIAAVRAHAALIAEDIPRVLEVGRQALELLPPEDEMHCETAVALGGAYWALGDVHRSEQSFATARSGALLTGWATLSVPSGCYVGMQQSKQGRLKDAMESYQEGIRLGSTPDGVELPVAGFALIHAGDIEREWNSLAQAENHLVRGVDLCLQLSQADVLADGYVCLARLLITLHRYADAQALLEKAEQLTREIKVDPFVLCWLDACKVRFWLATGDLDAAARWVETTSLKAADPISYHYDLHHINLARVLVYQYQASANRMILDQVLPLLDQLADAAEKADWVNEQIQVYLLKALLLSSLNHKSEALTLLQQALSLAEPGGYIRTFVDEGAPMRSLLEAYVRKNNGITAGKLVRYAGLLLAHFDQVEQPEPLIPAGGIRPAMVEPLTEREHEVLKLLATGMTSTEIAVKMFVAPSTVRTHIKNIYGKLDSNRRIEAVQRARELHLL